MRVQGWLVAALVVGCGAARAGAQTPGEMFLAATRGDRRVTPAEARRIADRTKTAADRRSLQRQVDPWADRVMAGDAEMALRRAGARNLAGTARAQVRAMVQGGAIGEAAMRRGLAIIVQGGFTPAERRAVRAQLGLLTSPHHAPAPVRVAAAADLALRRAEEDRDLLTPRPFNLRLPTRPGEGNRARTRDGLGGEMWPVAAGAPLHHGLGGAPRGTLAATTAKVNFGERRRVNGQWMLYVFSTRIDTAAGPMSASGWVPESAFGGAFRWMPTVEAPTPIGGAKGSRYAVTGGDLARFGRARVNPNVPRYEQRERASDYLLRPGGLVNLLYNLPGEGGVSIDTFPAGVTFVRAAQVPLISIPLYHEGSARRFTVSSMSFVYGRVVVPGGEDRYGWIALPALKPLP